MYWYPNHTEGVNKTSDNFFFSKINMSVCLPVLHVPVQENTTERAIHQAPSPHTHCVSGLPETGILHIGPTCTYRRNISKWQNEKTSAELTHTHYLTPPVQVWSWKPHAGQGITVSIGVQLKISKNSCGRDEACHNLWAFMLRLQVHMPTSRKMEDKALWVFHHWIRKHILQLVESHLPVIPLLWNNLWECWWPKAPEPIRLDQLLIKWGF